MRADKQNNYSKPYSLKHCSKIKAKKSREEECKYKITWQCVIEEETEELGEKPLCHPPSGKSIH